MPDNDSTHLGGWLREHTFIEWYKQAPKTGENSRVWEGEFASEGPEVETEWRLGPTTKELMFFQVDGRELETRPTASVGDEVLGYGYHLLRFWTYVIRCPRLEKAMRVR